MIPEAIRHEPFLRHRREWGTHLDTAPSRSLFGIAQSRSHYHFHVYPLCTTGTCTYPDVSTVHSIPHRLQTVLCIQLPTLTVCVLCWHSLHATALPRCRSGMAMDESSPYTINSGQLGVLRSSIYLIRKARGMYSHFPSSSPTFTKLATCLGPL